MTTILTIVHVLVSFFLVAIVLLQQGKGADMGAAFGGGSSQTVFGADGPVSLLGKVTTAAAIIFMITSLTLAYKSSHNNSSVMAKIPVVEEAKKAVEPAPQLIETKVATEAEEASSHGQSTPPVTSKEVVPAAPVAEKDATPAETTTGSTPEK